jgi:hypothetical protein
MCSDRENPGAPNPNGGPQAQATAYRATMPFSDHEFCKISPQSPGNGISESLDSKFFRMSMSWTH